MIKEMIAKKIWEKIREYNFKLQVKEPGLKDFYWPKWEYLQPELRREKIFFLDDITNNGLKEVTEKSVIRRHSVSVLLKVADGWKLEEKRNNILRHDPFLLPLKNCPDWLFDWCMKRDEMEREIILEMLA